MLELLRQPCTFKFVFCVQNKIQILNGFLSAPSSLFHSHTLGGTRLLSHFADKKQKVMWKVSAESHSGVKLTALMGLHYIHFALENAFYDSYIFGMYGLFHL